MPLKCSVKAQVPREYMFFRYGESEFEVRFETGSRSSGVSAHLCVTKSRTNAKFVFKISISNVRSVLKWVYRACTEHVLSM